MGMYDSFKADAELESKKGVIIDYGDFRVTILRASSTNKAYQKALDAKTRPYMRAIKTETMSPERSMAILREVYAEEIVVNWEIQEDGKWKKGIEGPDGAKKPFNSANVLEAFENLPDLFLDIQEQSTKLSLFRATIQENQSGNS